jgi:ArsR family transcriptional regulator
MEKKCACKLLETFNITQPTLSYHMKMLVDCKLVFSEKCCKWTYYTLNDDVLHALSAFLTKETKEK